MAADALPMPWAEPTPGAVTYVRQYRDVLGRPMRGVVTITPTKLAVGDVVAGPVTVELVGGELSVSLPPGSYTLTASLRTEEGARVTDTSTATL